VGKSKANGELKNCRLCDCSLSLTPSDKEVKAGQVEARFYCCHPQALLTRGEDIVPQLCELVRRNPRLCGMTARWWAPIAILPFDLTLKVQVKKQNSGGSGYGVATTKVPGVKYPQPPRSLKGVR